MTIFAVLKRYWNMHFKWFSHYILYIPWGSRYNLLAIIWILFKYEFCLGNFNLISALSKLWWMRFEERKRHFYKQTFYFADCWKGFKFWCPFVFMRACLCLCLCSCFCMHVYVKCSQSLRKNNSNTAACWQLENINTFSFTLGNGRLQGVPRLCWKLYKLTKYFGCPRTLCIFYVQHLRKSFATSVKRWIMPFRIPQ